MRWTIPNTLTFLRLLAAPGVAVMFLYFHRPWADWLALALFVGAAITDYFDGYLARAQGTVSKLGVFLDPIADKIMVGAVILMLAATRDIAGIHIAAAMIILLREIAVSGLREFLAGLQVSVPVSRLAKWKTTFQIIALGALILAGAVPHIPFVQTVGIFTLWAAAMLTLVTGWDYLRVGIKHMD